MVAGGSIDSYLLVKAMTTDSLLEVGEAYDVVDGLPFLGAKLETLNLIMSYKSINIHYYSKYRSDVKIMSFHRWC